MHHLALGGLADQLLVGRLDLVGTVLHDLPLSCGRKREAQTPLQPFQAIERQSRPVLQQRDHARRCRIVLLDSHARRRPGGEDLAAQVATQLLQFVYRGPEGCLPFDPHQVTGFDALVHGAFFTVRTRISRLERLMRHPDLLRAHIIFGTMAAVPFGLLGRRGFLASRGVGTPGLLFLAGVVQNPLNHLAGRFRGRPEQPLLEPLDRHTLFLQLLGQKDQRLHRRVQLGVFLLAQGRLRPLQDRLQLAAVQVHPLAPAAGRGRHRRRTQALARSLDLPQVAPRQPHRPSKPLRYSTDTLSDNGVLGLQRFPMGRTRFFSHGPTSTRRQAGAPFAAVGSPPDSRTTSWCASRASVAPDGFCGHHGNRPFDSRF